MDVVCHLPIRAMVQPRGIEPLSMVLQTTAMTTSAKVAKLKLLRGDLRELNPY